MVGGLSVSLAGVIDPSTQKEVPFFVPSTIIMKMLFLFLCQLDRANLSGNHVVSLYFWPNTKTKISGETISIFTQLNVGGALMSLGIGLEFFKTLRVGD